MKKIALCFILLFSTTVQAEQEEDRYKVICEFAASVADMSMYYRQRGYNPKLALTLVNEGLGDNRSENKFIEKMYIISIGIIHGAYQIPISESEEGKEKAISDYSNDTYMQCRLSNYK